MTAEEAAWDALSNALEDYEPPCTDIDAFTADSLTEGERALCVTLCSRCRVSDLCSAYATAARVKVGVWAGVSYTNKGAKKPTQVTDAEADSPAPITNQKEGHHG